MVSLEQSCHAKFLLSPFWVVCWLSGFCLEPGGRLPSLILSPCSGLKWGNSFWLAHLEAPIGDGQHFCSFLVDHVVPEPGDEPAGCL